jgi:CRP/FNR family transcriptional regulator, cyclic AMP receptor protein
MRPDVAATGWIPLLEVDRDLAGRLPDATVTAAAPFAVAPTEWLDPGEWNPRGPEDGERTAHMGLLVLNGFIARRVQVLDRAVTELLGPGDLLLPWEPDRTEPFDAGARWTVLETSRVAVLDRRFTSLAARWPEISVALLGRTVSRSRAFALGMAIGQLTGVDLRLLVLLWHVAERWGSRDRDDAFIVPVHLTHEVLATLVSAQRPSVTRALGTLADDGRVTRREDGLLALHGEPPQQFRRMRPDLS